VFFAPVPAIDPVFVGGLQRDTAFSDYPHHAIHPAVLDAPGLLFSPGRGPLRSWLISSNDEWVLQLQLDRFYVNWRRRGNEYPRFSGEGGVLERALTEIERFRGYCQERLRAEVRPSTVELAKVDLMVEGVHWSGVEDLGRLVSLIGHIGNFAKSATLELGMNIVDHDPAGPTRAVGLSLSTETLVNGRLARALKIETRCTSPLPSHDCDAIRAGFMQLNVRANGAFYGLIDPNELGRFAKKS
jgi:hypothetical protein